MCALECEIVFEINSFNKKTVLSSGTHILRRVAEFNTHPSLHGTHDNAKNNIQAPKKKKISKLAAFSVRLETFTLPKRVTCIQRTLLTSQVHSFRQHPIFWIHIKDMREGLKCILPEVPGQICYLCMHACVPATLDQDDELEINFPQLDFLYSGENFMPGMRACGSTVWRVAVIKLACLKYNTK